MNQENPKKESQETSSQTQQNLVKKELESSVESAENDDQKIKELDPTHFGDWQIKGRAIDFS